MDLLAVAIFELYVVNSLALIRGVTGLERLRIPNFKHTLQGILVHH